MRIVLSIIGIFLSYFLVRYRESIADSFMSGGGSSWADKVGGPYAVVIYAALIIFFWSIAELTGTTSVLFGPLFRLIPGAPAEVPAF